MIILLLALTPKERQNIGEYVELYGHDLYNFALRLTLNKSEAEDLFQQTWLKVVNNIEKYSEDNFRSWLFKICSNQFKDNYRKKKRYSKLVKDDYADGKIKDYVLNSADSGEDTLLHVERRDIKIIMLDKINNLPEKQREPILMFYYRSMKYEEIATALNVPVGTVRSRINTAKKALKNQMEGEVYV